MRTRKAAFPIRQFATALRDEADADAAICPACRRLNLPVVGKAPEEAAGHFAWFAHFAAIDSPASSKRTRELLGWQPKQPGLIADLDRPRYFES